MTSDGHAIWYEDGEYLSVVYASPDNIPGLTEMITWIPGTSDYSDVTKVIVPAGFKMMIETEASSFGGVSVGSDPTGANNYTISADMFDVVEEDEEMTYITLKDDVEIDVDYFDMDSDEAYGSLYINMVSGGYGSSINVTVWPKLEVSKE